MRRMWAHSISKGGDRAICLVLPEANVRSRTAWSPDKWSAESVSGAKGEPQRTIFVL